MAGLAGFKRPAPRVGLGLAALGRPGYINLGRVADLGSEGSGARTEAAMRARAEEVLDAAWAAGVRWFDAARSYGLAEDFLGTWLRKRGIDPADVCVTSKWGYRYTARWKVDTSGAPHEVKDHSQTHLEAQLPETLTACGEFVRLYQIHSATFDSGVLKDVAVHTSLARLRRERGWRLGLSLSGTQQAQVLEEALTLQDPLATEEAGCPRLFDCVQVTYNVLEQAPHEALLKARATGLDIIVKEALANGRTLQSPALVEAAVSEGVPPDQLSLACVLAQPFEPFVLSGAVTAEQLASNLHAEALAERLRAEPAKLAALMAATRQDSEAYWKDRSALAWN
mmetsp:Transcript_16894/g.52878  ORF Transcript_16894/g.52878 Transcript_16894/m.52878 type:complete len:339 (+) Transcript_16894:48-1064(+)